MLPSAANGGGPHHKFRQKSELVQHFSGGVVATSSSVGTGNKTDSSADSTSRYLVSGKVRASAGTKGQMMN